MLACIAQQINKCISDNDSYDRLQNVFRRVHSIDTVLHHRPNKMYSIVSPFLSYPHILLDLYNVFNSLSNTIILPHGACRLDIIGVYG